MHEVALPPYHQCMERSYVFITGGVVSSVGKGIVTASLGALLKARGLRVAVLKLNPYINVDPGTMSPYQHGEVFVTDDGAETDLDLGHYERFLDQPTGREHSVSSGQIYEEVIRQERRGDFLGGTIQPIPHVTNEIQRRIERAGESADFVIVEVGGTVGDMEGQPFLEAISQMRARLQRGRVVNIHVTLLPRLGATGELKTKPTQHSVRELRSFGIQPDVIIPRSDYPVDDAIRSKIGLFCNVDPAAVIPLETASSIYRAPLMIERSGLAERVLDAAGAGRPPADLSAWDALENRMDAASGPPLRVAIVGKYVGLHDAYISIREALVHAALAAGARIETDWVAAEAVEPGRPADALGAADAIVLCPGFGAPGGDGTIATAGHARRVGVPFLGICLGLQMMVCEIARSEAGMTGAHSTEFDPDTPHPVISLLSEQEGVTDYGGTMRLGGYDCDLVEGTLAHEAYGVDRVRERHRHRYEVSTAYLPALEQAGLRVAGRSPDGALVEIAEVVGHPWMVGVQFHPEFTSRPHRPNPLFRGLIAAAVDRAKR